MVIQLARELKFRVVNVVKSSPLIAELKELGAGSVLLDADDLRGRVMAVTQGAPVRLVFDAIGGVATGRIASCLVDEGTVINYGALSGEACQISSEMVATRGIRLCGINPSRQLARHTPEERKAVYERIGGLLAAGKLQARIAATYELSNSIEAIRHASTIGDKRFGKVVIRIKHLQPPAVVAAAATPAAAEPAPAPSVSTDPASGPPNSDSASQPAAAATSHASATVDSV